MKVNIDISPEVLKWVIARTDISTVPPQISEYLTSWSEGEKKPTFNQVEKVSKATGIPLDYFFLHRGLHHRNPSKNPKIPDVAAKLGVETTNLFQMMRELEFSCGRISLRYYQYCSFFKHDLNIVAKNSGISRKAIQ